MLKLLVIGNLGKDAVVNQVGSKTVINFSVAHTEKYKDAQGNQVSKTTWVDAAWWTDRTAVAPYLKKGTQVYLEGIPEIKTFAKTDGTTGTSLVLRVGSCQLLGGANGNSSNNSATASAGTSNTDFSAKAPQPVTTGADDGDLPF